MADVGDKAPEFALPGVAGGTIETHALSDALSDGPVVLAFYVFDFHPACTREWCSIRDTDWLTLLDDVTVLGIGTDCVFSHRQFAEDLGLRFALLSDSDGTVSERYDVLYDELNGHRRVSKRAIFVVSSDGVVRYRWVADEPHRQPTLDAVRQVLADDTESTPADV